MPTILSIVAGINSLVSIRNNRRKIIISWFFVRKLAICINFMYRWKIELLFLTEPYYYIGTSCILFHRVTKNPYHPKAKTCRKSRYAKPAVLANLGRTCLHYVFLMIDYSPSTGCSCTVPIGNKARNTRRTIGPAMNNCNGNATITFSQCCLANWRTPVIRVWVHQRTKEWHTDHHAGDHQWRNQTDFFPSSWLMVQKSKRQTFCRTRNNEPIKIKATQRANGNSFHANWNANAETPTWNMRL